MREIRESSVDLFKFGKISLLYKEGLFFVSLWRLIYKLVLINVLFMFLVFLGIL